MTLRLAAATEDFGTELRSAIQLAAENPVEGLRLNARTEVRASEFGDTALRQLRHYVEEHRMQVAGLYYSARHSLDTPKSLDERLDGIRRTIMMTRKLGTSDVLVRLGTIPDPDVIAAAAKEGPSNNDVNSLLNPFSFAPPATGRTPENSPSDAQRFETLCQILNDLTAFGSRHGATLQLLVSGYPADRIRRLSDQVTTGPLGIVFDPAVCVMSGRSPVETFRDLYSHLKYVRFRDAQKDVDGGGVEVRHGEGRVEWDEMIPTLLEAGNHGWVTVERTGGDQRPEDVSWAIQAIRKLLPEAPRDYSGGLRKHSTE
jgi:sugar phosphate isomerase/epimerase